MTTGGASRLWCDPRESHTLVEQQRLMLFRWCNDVTCARRNTLFSLYFQVVRSREQIDDRARIKQNTMRRTACAGTPPHRRGSTDSIPKARARAYGGSGGGMVSVVGSPVQLMAVVWRLKRFVHVEFAHVQTKFGLFPAFICVKEMKAWKECTCCHVWLCKGDEQQGKKRMERKKKEKEKEIHSLNQRF